MVNIEERLIQAMYLLECSFEPEENGATTVEYAAAAHEVIQCVFSELRGGDCVDFSHDTEQLLARAELEDLDGGKYD
jgi:hypothetical protein